VIVLGGAGLLAGPAAGSDQALLSVVTRQVPMVQAELDSVGSGDPDGTQRAYDLARDLQLSLAAVGPTPGCRAFASAARRYAQAAVRVPEAVDRLVSVTGARSRATTAYSALTAARASCVPRGGGPGRKAAPLRISPGPGEVFFGQVVARAPRGADRAEVILNGRSLGAFGVRRGQARGTIRGAAGRYNLRLRFIAGDRVIGARQADGVWLLPSGATAARPATSTDPASQARLARIGSNAGAIVGLWVQNLGSGRAAGFNSAARFPAASTVKLGLMIAALQRAGRNPTASAFDYDLRQIGGWSSNLATNRLLTRLGGTRDAGGAIAQAVFARLGATSTTFPGGYIVGTELQPAMPTDPARRAVPSVSRRVTTPRDLAKALFAIHAAATGDRAARSRTGLSLRAARVLLGDLLASQQAGDNLSLYAPGVSGGSLIAQKNGWISDARLGAALIYPAAGPPRIATLTSYRASGVSLATARGWGTQVARAALAVR
jgi:beta-lactamase class A